MSQTQQTVLVAEIPAIIEDPARGIISLVGDHGGLSLITGSTHSSGLVMGTLSIETEHGVVYLDPDQETEISEDNGHSLTTAQLDSVNEALTELLGHEFNWTSSDVHDDERLDALAHIVGAEISNLIDG